MAKIIEEPLWGIDLGGTKIEGIVLRSLEDPEILSRLRIPTESNKGYNHIINQIKNIIHQLSIETGLEPRKIGIGTPGCLEPLTQTMKNCNTTCLIGMPLKKDLEKILKIPVAIANDANCFALAETKFGIVREKIQNPEVVFGIIMGTGVGGGIVVNGKIVNGHHGLGGEWGHNYLDESGGKCYCGRTGCVETIISGPALEKYYQELSGNKISLQKIYQLYKKRNNQHAIDTINRLIHFFGKAVAVVINIIDPDAIVLGGGVGNIDVLYSKGVKEIEKYIFNNRVDTSFLKPKLGDSAGVFGAAGLSIEI
ncbi:MAG: ROK family protein [Bacteroidales bacterium]|nr:ROK family protein [Bacteroidales bacterium]